MKSIRSLVIVPGLLIFLFPNWAFAEDVAGKERIMQFDQTKVTHPRFRFENELKPKPNGFELREAAFMSNEIGERWAIITVENTSSGRRFLKRENIVATFADGSQVNPSHLDENARGGELLTKTIFFGVRKFPIVKVDVR